MAWPVVSLVNNPKWRRWIVTSNGESEPFHIGKSRLEWIWTGNPVSEALRLDMHNMHGHVWNTVIQDAQVNVSWAALR